MPAAGKQHPSLAVVGMFTDGKNGCFPYETVPVATAPMVSFLAWWKDVKSTDRYGWRMTRRGIVLAMSNKDGGAHVTSTSRTRPTWRRWRARLNTPVETASGVTITIGESSEPPTGVVVRAMVRHVVEEACFAIRAAAAEVLGDLAEPPEPVVQPVPAVRLHADDGVGLSRWPSKCLRCRGSRSPWSSWPSWARFPLSARSSRPSPTASSAGW